MEDNGVDNTAEEPVETPGNGNGGAAEEAKKGPSIDFDGVRLAMRQRIFSAGIATGVNDFHGENMPPLNVAGKPFWIDEFMGGFVTRRWTTMRRRQYTVLMRYDIYVPLNSGTLLLSQKQALIEDEFDVMDESRCNVSAAGWEIEVYRIEAGGDVRDNSFQIRPMTLYLRCASKTSQP